MVVRMENFLVIAPSIFAPSICIIGLVYFIVALFSFRVFSCSLKTFFLPGISCVLGMLWNVLHVLIYACCIAAVYVSFGIGMSIYETVAYVVVIVGILLFFSSGVLNRLYRQVL